MKRDNRDRLRSDDLKADGATGPSSRAAVRSILEGIRPVDAEAEGR